MSYETNYAAIMRQREDARSRTPEAVADRECIRRAGEQAKATRKERFPALTADNAEAAIQYQDEQFNEALRLERLKAGLIKEGGDAS